MSSDKDQLGVDQIYGQMLKNILDNGSEIVSRNSKTKRLTNLTATFHSTPLISARKTSWKNALREFEWFMTGSTNINDLHPSVHSWWAPWANSKGEIKNNYSKQFRHAENAEKSVDQVEYVINTLRNTYASRRCAMTTWNAADMLDPTTPLSNCHGSWTQFFVEPGDSLHMTMLQRSCDMLLGVPHNWLQYWGFLLYIARQTALKPGSFTWIGGDCHIYEAHLGVAKKTAEAALNLNVETPQLVYECAVRAPFKAEDFKLSLEYSPVISDRPKLIV